MDTAFEKLPWAEKLLALVYDTMPQDHYTPEQVDYVREKFVSLVKETYNGVIAYSSEDWGTPRFGADTNLQPQIRLRILANEERLSSVHLSYMAVVLFIRPNSINIEAVVLVRDYNGAMAHELLEVEDRIILDEEPLLENPLLMDENDGNDGDDDDDFIRILLERVFLGFVGHLQLHHCSGYAVEGKLADGTGMVENQAITSFQGGQLSIWYWKLGSAGVLMPPSRQNKDLLSYSSFSLRIAARLKIKQN